MAVRGADPPELTEAEKEERARIDLARSFRLCPRAKSVTCRDTEHLEPHLIAQGCQRWTCNVCGPRRRANLARRIAEAEPNRMITLTCLHVGEVAERLEIMRRGLPRLITKMRKRKGEIEYVRFIEECRDGYPHFHVLARSQYLPHKELKTEWEKITGAYVIDVRKVHGRTVAYAAKYVTKAMDAKLGTMRQRVSVSRGFWKDREVFDEFMHFERKEWHPTAYVKEYLTEYAIERIRPRVYHVANEREPGDELPEELENAEFGIELETDPTDDEGF